MELLWIVLICIMIFLFFSMLYIKNLEQQHALSGGGRRL